jgi:hypothetical protein
MRNVARVGSGRGVLRDGRRGARLGHGGVVLALALVASLALGAANAAALQTRFPQDTFHPAGGFSLYGPQGIAVDQQSGGVYVSDISENAVFVFAADGTPATKPKLTEADGVTPAALSSPVGVAVDNSGGATQGYVYVASTGAGAVRQFDATGAATAEAPITAASMPADGTPQPGGLPDVLNNGSLSLNGVATDSAGNVYVTDAANEVIDVFTSGGDFVSQLGAGHVGQSKWVAVNPAGDLYVTGSGLIKLSANGECVNSCDAIDYSGLSGVATDAAGHVYVSEYEAISEFDADGNWISTFDTATARPQSPGAGYVSGVAVDADGAVYATDLLPGRPAAARFGPAVTIPAAITGAAEGVTVTSATLEGTVEPDGEPVTECEFEYGTSPAYGQSVPCAESPASLDPGATAIPVHADVAGLELSSIYFFRLSVGNANGAGIFPGAEFATPPALEITPEDATENSGRSIELHALVNDLGAALTACAFEYVTQGEFEADGGTFSSLHDSVPCEPAAASIPADGDTHPVSAELSGLVGNSTYHYRITATNGNGTARVEGLEFTTAETPPIVSTGAATELSTTGARLAGLVNPSGLPTTYYFEYGTSTAYGSKLLPEGDAGEGGLARPVSTTVTGLHSATTYHFRLVAINSVGTETGSDVAFTTPGAAAKPIPAPPVAPGAIDVPRKKHVPKGRCPRHRHQGAHKHERRAHTRCAKKSGQKGKGRDHT